MIDSIEYWNPLGKSDHAIIKFRMLCYLPKPKSSLTRYNYNRGNYAELKKELDIDWSTKLNNQPTIDDKWNYIKTKITTAIENHIPKRRNIKGVPGTVNPL